MVKKHVYTPDRGDVVWVDLSPTRGREQKKVRPALVLSPRSYNKKTNLMVAVPVTSQKKGYPFEVEFIAKKVSGVILSDQLRTLDWKVRKVKYIEKVDSKVLSEVQSRIVSLVTG